jgi:hypothetical protein
MHSDRHSRALPGAWHAGSKLHTTRTAVQAAGPAKLRLLLRLLLLGVLLGLLLLVGSSVGSSRRGCSCQRIPLLSEAPWRHTRRARHQRLQLLHRHVPCGLCLQLASRHQQLLKHHGLRCLWLRATAQRHALHSVRPAPRPAPSQHRRLDRCEVDSAASSGAHLSLECHVCMLHANSAASSCHDGS